MKNQSSRREINEQDKNEFFIIDVDGDFFKDLDDSEFYSIEPNMHGAHIFTNEEALEVLRKNPDDGHKIIRVGDIFDENEYDIIIHTTT